MNGAPTAAAAAVERLKLSLAMIIVRSHDLDAYSLIPPVELPAGSRVGDGRGSNPGPLVRGLE